MSTHVEQLSLCYVRVVTALLRVKRSRPAVPARARYVTAPRTAPVLAHRTVQHSVYDIRNTTIRHTTIRREYSIR